MSKNDHFEAQKCHFRAFLASCKISFSSLQHPNYNLNNFGLKVKYLRKRENFGKTRKGREWGVKFKQPEKE